LEDTGFSTITDLSDSGYSTKRDIPILELPEEEDEDSDTEKNRELVSSSDTESGMSSLEWLWSWRSSQKDNKFMHYPVKVMAQIETSYQEYLSKVAARKGIFNRRNRNSSEIVKIRVKPTVDKSSRAEYIIDFRKMRQVLVTDPSKTRPVKRSQNIHYRKF